MLLRWQRGILLVVSKCQMAFHTLVSMPSYALSLCQNTLQAHLQWEGSPTAVWRSRMRDQGKRIIELIQSTQALTGRLVVTSEEWQCRPEYNVVSWHRMRTMQTSITETCTWYCLQNRLNQPRDLLSWRWRFLERMSVGGLEEQVIMLINILMDKLEKLKVDHESIMTEKRTTNLIVGMCWAMQRRQWDW
jgi:hypothetical protein